MTIQELVADWRGAGVTEIVIRAYRMMLVEPTELAEPQALVLATDVRAILGYGPLRYVHAGNGRPRFDPSTGHIRGVTGTAQLAETEPGPYVALVTLAATESEPNAEQAVERRLGSAVGLLVVLMGRNVVFDRIFEYEMNLGTDEVSASGPMTLVPQASPVPGVTKRPLRLVREVAKRIGELDEGMRNRVLLSLRWCADGEFSDSFVDGFLKLWIAIEVLAMPDTMNPSPVSDLLASAYNLSSRSMANERFGVGRLYRIRGRIVHDGEDVPLNLDVIRYLEALYQDVLLRILGLPTERRAEAIRQTDPRAIEAVLAQA